MSDTIAAMTEAIRGRVITPQDADFDDARAVYNGMHDRRPAAVVQCADAADVMSVVAAARDSGMDLAVRGGGHSVPGFGTVDEGLVIDLSKMNNVRVDPVKRVAHVGGGATLGDVDHATYPFGLAVPAGVVAGPCTKHRWLAPRMWGRRHRSQAHCRSQDALQANR